MAGIRENLSVSCTASPPSIGAFHRVGRPDIHDTKTTHCISGEHCGAAAILILLMVNCLGLPPSVSILQIAKPLVRLETKITERPSGVSDGSSSMLSLTVSCF